MFSWFHHTDPEELKKEEPFVVAWYRKDGPLIPCSGLEMTSTGLTFTTSSPPPDFKDFNLQFEVRSKPINARVQSKKPLLVSTSKGLQHKFVCKFVGISADNWDLIVRYVNDLAEATHEGSFYDANVPDDEFRSLPSDVQSKIIEDLAKKERLETPPQGVAPLIRMTAQGEQRTKEGKRIKKFAVHSRVMVKGEENPKDFDTRYAIDDGGNVTCLTEAK